MYVIATVICPNFHFSVSPHVPFLNLLFEQIANSNEYLLAKIGVDTAENEPLEVLFNIIQYYSFVSLLPTGNGAPHGVAFEGLSLEHGDDDVAQEVSALPHFRECVTNRKKEILPICLDLLSATFSQIENNICANLQNSGMLHQ